MSCGGVYSSPASDYDPPTIAKTFEVGWGMARQHHSAERSAAWIAGSPVSLDEAAAEAARLLKASAQPLIAGLATDVDGARRAIALAERVGGVIDHAHSTPILRDLDSQRESGVMITTPGEARIRADVLLLAGDGLVEAWPALNDRLLSRPAHPGGIDVPRRIVHLTSGAETNAARLVGVTDTVVFGRGAAFAANLAGLRARVNGRRPSTGAAPEIDAISALLGSARFGVAIWSASALDALEIEMLNGLVRDLNKTSRFSSLPLAAHENGAGVLATCGWMTGFPMRTGFGSGGPAHDPWRFDAERLVAAQETDCVVWISAFGAPPPRWAGGAISVALCDRPDDLARKARVLIEVARPGVDHDAVLHSPDAGTLVAVDASAPSADRPSVAEALARIDGMLPGARAC